MRPRPLAVLLAAALLVLASGCTAPGAAPTSATPAATPAGGNAWTFVVVGDSRAGSPLSSTGVSPDLPAIASAIAAEEPAFVLFTGDLVSGWMVDLDDRAQFEHWEEAMRPVHDYANGTGVQVYVVRGNHEDWSARLRDAYLATVAQGMPANGPPDQVCLTYSFSYGGARFIGLDQYTGMEETVDQDWLDAELNATPEPVRFVFGHEPAWSVSKGEDDLSTHPDERDAFWTSLADHCVTAYFCGHEHLYARGEAQGVAQVIVGTGGAPASGFAPSAADPALQIDYPAEAVPASQAPLGYLVVRVDPANGTVSGTERVVDLATGQVTDGDAFDLAAGRWG